VWERSQLFADLVAGRFLVNQNPVRLDLPQVFFLIVKFVQREICLPDIVPLVGRVGVGLCLGVFISDFILDDLGGNIFV
jgi:hypothetical protein